MKLTTKGRFAVVAMLDLAKNNQEFSVITLSDISQRQGISQSYLEQLFMRLRKSGLVASVRGPGGGYRIAHSFSDISIASIIRAVDEEIDATQCGGKENCQEEKRCMTHDLWMGLNQEIWNYLSKISLADLLGKQKFSKEDSQQVFFVTR